jgi:hypothetical protein
LWRHSSGKQSGEDKNSPERHALRDHSGGVVALFIGGVEALTLIGDKFGLEGAFWGTNRLAIAMATRNSADTLVPIRPPIFWNAATLLCIAAAEAAIAVEARTTTVEH